MTADQIIYSLFVENWLLTTFIFPGYTCLYAIATDNAPWFMGSLTLAIIYKAGGSRR